MNENKRKSVWGDVIYSLAHRLSSQNAGASESRLYQFTQKLGADVVKCSFKKQTNPMMAHLACESSMPRSPVKSPMMLGCNCLGWLYALGWPISVRQLLPAKVSRGNL